MTSGLQIQDLSLNKALDAKSLSGIRGGSNYGSVGGQTVVGTGSGPLFAVNAPTLVQTDFHPVTKFDLDVANVIGSRNTNLFQM